ncbi:MAG: YfiR family protein [Desulfuromonadaceae bacterium]|nr:YfiR family protein [Desulfuromonadaceae bacterium]
MAQPEEQQVKTAILYNFAKFVTWPEEAFTDDSSPLIIAILGDDPLHKRIDSLEDKKIGNRSIAIHHWSRHDLKRRKKVCQILYVAASERKRLTEILTTIAAKPILTVSDLPGFAEKGGTLNFEKKHKNIRFAINLDACNQAGLNISSKLFPLATTIIKDGQLRQNLVSTFYQK